MTPGPDQEPQPNPTVAHEGDAGLMAPSELTTLASSTVPSAELEELRQRAEQAEELAAQHLQRAQEAEARANEHERRALAAEAIALLHQIEAEERNERAEAREKEVEKIFVEARTDDLTGILNRRGFEEKAGEILEDARILKIPVLAMLADIDNFKAVNDNWGHAMGDRTLVTVASELQSLIRATDVLGITGRQGGDEYEAILPIQRTQRLHSGERANLPSIMSAEEIKQVAESIRARIKHSIFTYAQTEGLEIGISVGYTIVMPGDSYAIEDIAHAADQSMYREKRSHRSAN